MKISEKIPNKNNKNSNSNNFDYPLTSRHTEGDKHVNKQIDGF